MPRPLLLLIALAACHPPARGPTTGAIAGVVRDSVTGAPIAGAQLAAHGDDSLRVASTRSAGDGSYAIAGLAPGRYGLVVVVPGISLQLTGIPVTAGHTTGFDVPVDPGEVDPPPRDFGQVDGAAIHSYQPADLDAAHGRIEGTVTDSASLERVAGAVIVATSPAAPDVLTVVSDEHGHFRIDAVPPGTYQLSAFYQVARRGQIEVRRGDIAVAGGAAVVVPMFVELTGTE